MTLPLTGTIGEGTASSVTTPSPQGQMPLHPLRDPGVCWHVPTGPSISHLKTNEGPTVLPQASVFHGHLPGPGRRGVWNARSRATLPVCGLGRTTHHVCTSEEGLCHCPAGRGRAGAGSQGKLSTSPKTWCGTAGGPWAPGHLLTITQPGALCALTVTERQGPPQ